MRAGGWHVVGTYLSPPRKSFNLNNERSQLRIPVAEITGARLRTVVITAIIALSTVRGIDLEFVSWSRKKIIAAIQQARTAQGLPNWQA